MFLVDGWKGLTRVGNVCSSFLEAMGNVGMYCGLGTYPQGMIHQVVQELFVGAMPKGHLHMVLLVYLCMAHNCCSDNHLSSNMSGLSQLVLVMVEQRTSTVI